VCVCIYKNIYIYIYIYIYIAHRRTDRDTQLNHTEGRWVIDVRDEKAEHPTR